MTAFDGAITAESSESDHVRAVGLMLSGAEQAGLSLGLLKFAPPEKLASVAAESALMQPFPTTMTEGFQSFTKAAKVANVGDLLPPLLIGTTAAHSVFNLGKSIYDDNRGDSFHSGKDMDQAAEGFSATLGFLIGLGLASRFGAPKWIGTGFGLAIGDATYLGSTYLAAHKPEWFAKF